MHRNVAAALVAALALGIGGCGGSETTTLGRAELVRQVGLACREGQREGTKQVRALRGANDRATFLAAILANQRTVADKIDDITTSGAAKADFETFKNGVHTRVEGLEKIVAAEGAERARLIRTLQPRLEATGNRMQEAIRRLGLDGCN